MGYYWAVNPEPPEELAANLGLDAEFDDQGQAEAWLSLNYPELAEVGVHAVSLYDGGRLVYGPMSLEP